ncbi:MAG: hypothetical protein PHR35_12310 [Kiritimatiellae bacterium]|nr:hypothetical protein [Kiritimatiellia bacterium]
MGTRSRSTEAARIGPESRPMLTLRFPVIPIRAALAPGGGTRVLRPVQEPPPGR